MRACVYTRERTCACVSLQIPKLAGSAWEVLRGKWATMRKCVNVTVVFDFCQLLLRCCCTVEGLLIAGVMRYTGEAGRLVPQVATGGFCGAVVDMTWAIGEKCLLAVSTDQTARIFAPWQGDWCEIARPQVRNPASNAVPWILVPFPGFWRLFYVPGFPGFWCFFYVPAPWVCIWPLLHPHVSRQRVWVFLHPTKTNELLEKETRKEGRKGSVLNIINVSTLDDFGFEAMLDSLRRGKNGAGAQVHGHDFSCVACLPASLTKSPSYASGSEEKVIRVLEAPRAFLSTLALSRGEVPDQATSAVQVRRPTLLTISIWISERTSSA